MQTGLNYTNVAFLLADVLDLRCSFLLTSLARVADSSLVKQSPKAKTLHVLSFRAEQLALLYSCALPEQVNVHLTSSSYLLISQLEKVVGDPPGKILHHILADLVQRLRSHFVLHAFVQTC